MAAATTDHSSAVEGKPPNSLRGHFFLIFLLALPVGISLIWLAEGLRRASRQRNAIAEIERAGGMVRYDFEIDESGARIENAEPPYPAWLRWLLGVDFFCPVVSVHLRIIWVGEGVKPRVTDDTMSALRDLTRLKIVDLGTRLEVNDDMLLSLTHSSHIEHLLLDCTGVTDAGLSRIAKLTNLETLFLCECRITDAGLIQLQSLTNLDELMLRGTQITDDGLMHLARLPNLKRVFVGGTRVTQSGAESLTAALPEIEIVGPVVQESIPTTIP